jgi:hypothetical protein
MIPKVNVGMQTNIEVMNQGGEYGGITNVVTNADGKSALRSGNNESDANCPSILLG